MADYFSIPIFLERVARLSIFTILIFTPFSNALLNAWATTVIHLITLLALSSFLINKAIRRDWKWVSTPLDKPAAALFLWCLVSFYFSLHRYTSFWTLVMLANYGILFYLTLHLFQTRRQIRRLVWAIAATAFFVSLIGFGKLYWGNPLPWWHYEFIRGNTGQLIATFSNKSHLAGYIVMMPPLTIGLTLTGVNDGQRFVLIALLFLFVTVLGLCMARSAWIAGFFGLTLLSFHLFRSNFYPKKKIVWAVSGGIVLGCVLLLLNTDLTRRLLTIGTGDLSGRIPLWKNIFKMIQDHPIVGTGPGTFTNAFTLYHPPLYGYRHATATNEYLEFVSETGLPILIGTLWLISGLFIKGFQKIRHPSRLVRGIAIGATCAIVSVAVDALANINFHLPAVAVNVSVLAALIVAPDPTSGPSI